MHLGQVTRDTVFQVDQVPDPELRAKLLRLGFLDGRVTCRHNIRNGPVVITRDGTELAIGRSLAGDIGISEAAET
jgi:ferrous iron transport protein A